MLGGLGFRIDKRSNFKITNVSIKQSIALKEISLKSRTFINFESAIHYGRIYFPFEGYCLIEIENIEGVVIKRSMLFLKNLFYKSHVPIDKVSIAFISV